MRWYLGGEAVELSEEAPASSLGDRVAVRTSQGTFTGLAVRSGDAILVSFRGQTFRLERRPASAEASATGGGSGRLLAPMPGLIVDVVATVGQELPKGSKIAVIEAMKTQIPIAMPFAGRVDSIAVEKGNQVESDALIAVVSPIEAG